MPRRFTDRDLALIRNRMGENIPVPAKRKAPSHEESRIQQAVIAWWAKACAGFDVPEVMLFAIPNAGKRGPVLGRIMKREGMRAGVSDLFLACPNPFGYHGLFIEMKTPDGAMSEAQKYFQSKATVKGYAAFACYDFDQAVNLITKYLKGEMFF